MPGFTRILFKPEHENSVIVITISCKFDKNKLILVPDEVLSLFNQIWHDMAQSSLNKILGKC